MKKLDRVFFQQPTLEVAKSILGTKLHFKGQVATITEAEAYIFTQSDLQQKPKNKRLNAMAQSAGHTYIYLIYGMYYCINITTEAQGTPASIFLRAGIHFNGKKHLNGPGNFTAAMKITTEHNLLDICESSDFFFTEGTSVTDVEITPRIGISSEKELLWRFVASKNIVKQLMQTPLVNV